MSIKKYYITKYKDDDTRPIEQVLVEIYKNIKKYFPKINKLELENIDPHIVINIPINCNNRTPEEVLIMINNMDNSWFLSFKKIYNNIILLPKFIGTNNV